MRTCPKATDKVASMQRWRRPHTLPPWSKVLLSFSIAVAIVGCGPNGRVKVYPVKGRVTFEGKPMGGGGSISFVPLAEQVGKTAAGFIKPDGTYVVGTY